MTIPIPRSARYAIALLGHTVFFAMPLVAQSSKPASDVALTGPAAAAVASVRHAYDRQDYSTALVLADSAMRRGQGSAELQTWRLASLAKRPGAGVVPMRSARRMASMNPKSAWAWIGLALTAAIVPDSVGVAESAAKNAMSLAPKDSLVQRMAREALGTAQNTAKAAKTPR